MATKKEIGERLEKIKEMVVEGFSSFEIAKQLNLSVRQIERDRSKLRKETVLGLGSKPAERFLAEFLMKYSSIYRKACRTFESTKNDNVKLGCLHLMQRHEETKMRVLQSVSDLKQSLDRIESVNKQRFQIGEAIGFMHTVRAEDEEKIRKLNHLIMDIKHDLEENNQKRAIERIKENDKKERPEW